MKKSNNKTNKKEPAPVATPEPARKSQGGLRDVSEADAKTVQRVRGAFLADTFMSKMTLAYKTITFNTACVKLFPNCQHVTISIDVQKRRLIVEPTVYYDENGLKFANFKDDKNVPRTSTTKFFCPMLFDFMEWNPTAKYRVLTIYQEFGNRKFMVFNLDDAQEVFCTNEEAEDGKKKRKTTVYVPDEWKGRFGYRVDELAEKRRVDFSNELIIIDNRTGERRVGNIESKRLTAEELIHEPFGGIRARKETKKDE